MDDKELIEKLADLEHEQWKYWTKQIYTYHKKEISHDLMSKWIQNWAPYDMLPNDIQEHDRKWARKVLDLLKASKVV